MACRRDSAAKEGRREVAVSATRAPGEWLWVLSPKRKYPACGCGNPQQNGRGRRPHSILRLRRYAPTLRMNGGIYEWGTLIPLLPEGEGVEQASAGGGCIQNLDSGFRRNDNVAVAPQYKGIAANIATPTSKRKTPPERGFSFDSPVGYQ